MKKFNYLIVSMLLAGGLAACSSNDDPEIETVETTSGLYVINNGNMSANIPSSITRYDYATGTSTPALQDAFMAANGVALGEGAGGAIIYGSKMYIPMTDSNIIWVTDPVTLKIIGTIRPEGDANSPRELTAADGKVFASMFTGYVCRIDTTSLTIDRTIQTGPNPEQMAVADGKLYVANSDGYNWNNDYAECSISIIDLATLSQTRIKDTSKILNPTEMASNGKEVFVVCKGNYDDVPSTVKRIRGEEVEEIAEATYIAVNRDRLYIINCTYGLDRKDLAFDVYDTSTLEKKGVIARQTEGTDSWIEAPAGIAVDPVAGDIVILSYYVTDQGFSRYTDPCYANIYSADGKFKKRFECGVGALGVTFINRL